MKKSSISLLVIAALAASFAACDSADKYASNSIAFNRVEAEQAYRLVGSAEAYETDADLSYGCKADLLMPTALYGQPVETLQDSILQAAFGKYGSNHSDVIAQALKAEAADLDHTLADTVMPDSVVSQYPNFLTRFDGFSSVEGDLETLTPKILSYAVTFSNYLPRAAHGMYGTRYINYDLTEGKIISLKDLFTAEGLAALPDAIRTAAKQMKETIGVTDITGLPAQDNFYITAGSEVVFAYQPYEVASYAQGEIQIPIPAYLLYDSLTPTGLRILLNN